MPQTQSLTVEGFGEMGRHLAGAVESATGAHSMVLIETSCSAASTATFANITKVDKTDLGIADATMTAEDTGGATDDTTQAVYEWTAGEDATILGCGLCNDDNNKLYMIVCFAEAVPLVTNDTLEVTMRMTFEIT